MHKLPRDIKYLSKEHDCKAPVIKHTTSLKRYLVQEYSNEISVFPSGKYLLAHPININTLYKILTLLKHLGECFWRKPVTELKTHLIRFRALLRWYFISPPCLICKNNIFSYSEDQVGMLH